MLDLRDRMRRFAMATLIVSQGVPMLLMGDEIGRTQDGNNNAYCQDNQLAWMDWSPEPREAAFFEFRLPARCACGAELDLLAVAALGARRSGDARAACPGCAGSGRTGRR